MMGWIVMVGGASVGFAHAALLRRAVRVGPRPAAVFARLLLVAALLVIAAKSGWLAAGALGWGAGFAASALVLAWRWR